MARIHLNCEKTHAPLFWRQGPLHTCTQLSEEFKRPVKIQSKICLQVVRLSGVKWNSNPSIHQALAIEGLKKLRSKTTFELFLIREANLLNSMWPGTELIKWVHVCWGPALSFFYCSFILIYRNCLQGSCQYLFINKISGNNVPDRQFQKIKEANMFPFLMKFGEFWWNLQ